MTVPAAPAWVERRDPPVPAPFAPWLDRVPGEKGPGADVDVLLDGALAALDDALGEEDGSRHDRARAFELLAADGFLTYACEAALDAADPEPVLRRLVAAVDAARGDPADR